MQQSSDLPDLLVYLLGLGPRELAALADSWHLRPRNGLPRQNAMLLYREMLDPASLRDTLELLPAHQRRLWFTLAASPDRTIPPSRAGLSPSALEEALGGLRTVGLVIPAAEADHGPRVPTELGRLAQALRDESQLADLARSPNPLTMVDRLPVSGLERLAARWSVDVPRGRNYRDSLVFGLCEEFDDPDTVGRVVSGQSEEARNLFHWLADRQGSGPASRAREALGGDPLRFRRAVRDLRQSCLLTETYRDDRRVLVLPRFLLRAEGREEDRAPSALATAEPARVEPGQPFALARDLLVLLDFLRANEVRWTVKDYSWPRRVLTQICRLMAVAEEPAGPLERFSFITSFCQKRNLLTTSDRRVVPGPGLDDWLQLSFEEQTRAIYQQWLFDPYWATRSTRYLADADAVRGRLQLLGWLHHLQPGRWTAVGALVTWAQAEAPYFLRARSRMVARGGRKYLQEAMQTWDAVEASFIAEVLSSVLHWAGLVDLGFDPESKLLAFRLTPRFKEVASLEEAAAGVGEPGTLVVQPDFTIVGMGLSPRETWDLLALAEPVGHDVVEHFRLTRASVLRALDGGATVASIEELLASHSRHQLAQSLRRNLADWSTGLRPVRFSRAVLVEVDDPDALDRLEREPVLAEMVVRRLSPTAAVLEGAPASLAYREDPLVQVSRELRKRGFHSRVVMPAGSGG